MKRLALIIASALAVASGASAQQICTRDAMGRYFCQPVAGANAANDMMRTSQANAQAAMQGSGSGRCDLICLAGRARQASRNRKVGKLISAGQCDAAVKLAQDAGDFPLADYAKANCTPAP